MRRTTTNAQVIEAVRLYTEEDLTIDEIADVLDMSRANVGYHLRKRGTKMRPMGQRPGNGGRPPAPPPAWVREAARMYKEGAILREIADRFGVSIPTVRDHLLKQGVKMRPRGGANNRRKAEAPARAKAAGKAVERVRCPTCRGSGQAGVKRPGYGWMPIWTSRSS